eukprot:COSAG05_NODE_10403_length_567_cov_0.850427_2_plen_32_part_01
MLACRTRILEQLETAEHMDNPELLDEVHGRED